MNAGSSRSHCIIYVIVEKAHADGRVEFGKLCLVVRDSGAQELCNALASACGLYAVHLSQVPSFKVLQLLCIDHRTWRAVSGRTRQGQWGRLPRRAT